MTLESGVLEVLNEVLDLSSNNVVLHADSALLGTIPEFDSMSIVYILTALEERYDITINDDEIDASIFESVGDLVQFVNGKLG
ncbi:MAG: acyl carrier protein [Pseudomonadales bacterium]|nr:acyl carrier protein [Pseudomonadales bacterium]